MAERDYNFLRIKPGDIAPSPDDVLASGAAAEVMRLRFLLSEPVKPMQELSVLDLGCGSRNTPAPDNKRKKPPYFCLIFGVNGARTVGVDLFPPNPEDAECYQHIQADLVPYVCQNGLARLPGLGAPFDIVHCRGLVNGISPSPILDDRLREERISLLYFRDYLIDQSAHLVRDQGILAIEDDWWRVQDGRIAQRLRG